MKKLLSIILLVAVAAAAGYGVAKLGHKNESGLVTESAYERVMRTKTIRCGYGLWPPEVLTKDANTGQIGGWAHDVIEALAKRANLKVEWVEETGWNNYAEALDSGRFDVFCSTGWIRGELAGVMRYSRPVAFSALHFFARSDDHRFDADLSVLNNPQYSLAVMDGEISQRWAIQHYPNAKQVAITQMADIMQLFLDVQSGKADGVFNDPSVVDGFLAKNPGALRRVTTKPLAVYANAYGLAAREEKLQSLLDTGLAEMINLGELDAILTKYDPTRTHFMPVASPYKTVE